MRKVIKLSVRFILPAIITLIVIALLALPHFAKYYINEHAKEYSGRNIFVNKIKINYFTTTFQIIDFKMFEADGLATFLSFDTLTIDVNPFHLLSSELDIEKIRLVRPEATIIRRDTTFNFGDIIAFYNSKPKNDTVSHTSSFKYILKNITLENGNFTFTDKGADYTNVMKNLGFSVPYISYNQEEISKAGLKFYFENGGFLQTMADYNQKNGIYNADFKVNRLDISPFLTYAKGYFRFNSIDGIVGGEFHLTGNINNLDSIKISGRGNIAGFSARDISGRKVLGARNTEISLNNTYPVKFSFKFDTIALTSPYLYFEMKDSTNNFLNILVDSGEDTEPVQYFYQINSLKIDSGQVYFRDNSYGEPFNYDFDEISLKVDSITSLAKWIKAYSTMRLNKKGKLKAELGINPSDPYELKTNYVITNFQLSDLNIISKYWVGFPILFGNMYYQGKSVITARKLTSENKLIVRNAKLGKKSGGLMNLPLKLALYLLEDVHGDIILDLPLTGDFNDPKTKIGKLVWQVFKNFVIKVVASPFRALSGLMGADPDEIKGIQFNFADTTLTDSHLRRIKLFTELEKKKPDMNIELTYYNDPELEKQEIAVEEAGKIFFSATRTDYKKEKSSFASFISKELKSDSVTVASGSVQLIGIQKLDSIQNSYAQKRIKKISEALHNIEDSTKIKIVVPNKEAPENVGSRPVFELKFSIDE